MWKKALLATALVIATVAIPALTPQKADAQVFFRGPRFGVGIGTPYYGGYGGYYGGYGYRPYYSTPYYGGYYNYGYYPRYYGGRYWRW